MDKVLDEVYDIKQKQKKHMPVKAFAALEARKAELLELADTFPWKMGEMAEHLSDYAKHSEQVMDFWVSLNDAIGEFVCPPGWGEYFLFFHLVCLRTLRY